MFYVEVLTDTGRGFEDNFYLIRDDEGIRKVNILSRKAMPRDEALELLTWASKKYPKSSLKMKIAK